MTAHNAFASLSEGWFHAQQKLSFDGQFEHGVRSFMVDFHWYQYDSDHLAVALCHGDNKVKNFNEKLGLSENCPLTRSSRLGRVPQQASYFLNKVRAWLEGDPSAIITLHIESYLGAGSRSHLQELFKATGLESYLYQPILDNYTGQWPTLKWLRESGQRLIVFSSNLWDVAESGTLSKNAIGGPVLHVFAYRETQYNLGEYPGCEMRTDGDRNGEAALFVMNHFYSFSSDHVAYKAVPNTWQHEKNNSYSRIWERVNICQKEQGRLPNFIAVDFVEQGAESGAQAVTLALNQLPTKHYHRFTSPSPSPLVATEKHKHDEL